MTRGSHVVVALIVWGALSFGAVYPWAYWPLAMGAALVGAWAVRTTRAWREPRPRALALACGGVAIALLIQIVPLPYAWFRVAAPAADGLLTQLQIGWLDHPPTWHSLSVAPESTLTALLLFVAFGLLLIGLMRAVSYMPLAWMVGQLTIFGAVLAAFGIVQRVIAGPSDILVYGFWKPNGLATPFGPFINRNHFAGWMVMMLPLAIAAAAGSLEPSRPFDQRRRRAWRPWVAAADPGRFLFAAIAILVMATSLVLTGSRSGLASLVVALAVLALLAARRSAGRSRRIAPALIFAVLILAAVGWAGVSRTAARFDRATTEWAERVAVWRDTAAVIRHFPLTGTGVGGYESAMLVYQTVARHSIYAQAHNEYLQVLAEGGLLVAAPVLIVLGVIVRSVQHRIRGRDGTETYWMRAGAIAGLAGIAAQSFVEFSLQMPGNALMCVFLLAVALHRPASSPDAHRV